MVKPEFDWGEQFDRYLANLSLKDEVKFRALIERVEKSELQDSIRKERVKKLSTDIYELRAQTSEHWLRGCYFQIMDNKYYITHGFSKQTNKTPNREIQKAQTIRDTIMLKKRTL